MLSQSKLELVNERHCLKGDGAEKLIFDFCGDRVLSLDRNASNLSASEATTSSDRTSRFKSSILSGKQMHIKLKVLARGQ